MKSNYKLPGLPSLNSAPKSTAKNTPARAAGTSKLAAFSATKITPVAFGRASHAATKTSQSGSQWSNLLKSTASGGIAGTLSSVTGLGGGIGSIISGIENLFGGGKSTPTALTAYELPTSQQQVISIGSSPSDTGIYGGPSAPTVFGSHSDHIVQSVKQAILNSSSLNDIIAEI